MKPRGGAVFKPRGWSSHLRPLYITHTGGTLYKHSQLSTLYKYSQLCTLYKYSPTVVVLKALIQLVGFSDNDVVGGEVQLPL